MQILAISKLKKGITPDKVGPHGADEVKHTLEAYLDGKIRNFWFQVNSPGVVFILECTDEDEARQAMNELPLVVAGLMDVDLIPLQPLLPLGTLIGRKFSI
jgi:hypothetical protein